MRSSKDVRLWPTILAGPSRTASYHKGSLNGLRRSGAEGFSQGTQLSCPGKSERIPNGREEQGGCQEGGHEERLGRLVEVF